MNKSGFAIIVCVIIAALSTACSSPKKQTDNQDINATTSESEYQIRRDSIEKAYQIRRDSIELAEKKRKLQFIAEIDDMLEPYRKAFVDFVEEYDSTEYQNFAPKEYYNDNIIVNSKFLSDSSLYVITRCRNRHEDGMFGYGFIQYDIRDGYMHLADSLSTIYTSEDLTFGFSERLYFYFFDVDTLHLKENGKPILLIHRQIPSDEPDNYLDMYDMQAKRFVLFSMYKEFGNGFDDEERISYDSSDTIIVDRSRSHGGMYEFSIKYTTAETKYLDNASDTIKLNMDYLYCEINSDYVSVVLSQGEKTVRFHYDPTTHEYVKYEI